MKIEHVVSAMSRVFLLTNLTKHGVLYRGSVGGGGGCLETSDLS